MQQSAKAGQLADSGVSLHHGLQGRNELRLIGLPGHVRRAEGVLRQRVNLSIQEQVDDVGRQTEGSIARLESRDRVSDTRGYQRGPTRSLQSQRRMKKNMSRRDCTKSEGVMSCMKHMYLEHGMSGKQVCTRRRQTTSAPSATSCTRRSQQTTAHAHIRHVTNRKARSRGGRNPSFSHTARTSQNCQG